MRIKVFLSHRLNNPCFLKWEEKKFLHLIQEHSGDLSPLEAGVYTLRLFSASEHNYYLFIDGFRVRIP